MLHLKFADQAEQRKLDKNEDPIDGRAHHWESLCESEVGKWWVTLRSRGKDYEKSSNIQQLYGNKKQGIDQKQTEDHSWLRNAEGLIKDGENTL